MTIPLVTLPFQIISKLSSSSEVGFHLMSIQVCVYSSTQNNDIGVKKKYNIINIFGLINKRRFI